MNRTFTAKPSNIERTWHVVDATGIPVGRLAAQVAQILRGKHKPTFTYNMDCGDFVIVINAERAVLTGNGKSDELIYWHTMWPGGLRSISRGKFHSEKPAEYVNRCIWGMIPKTRMGRDIIKRCKVYAGAEHPHTAQSPQPLKVTK